MGTPDRRARTPQWPLSAWLRSIISCCLISAWAMTGCSAPPDAPNTTQPTQPPPSNDSAAEVAPVPATDPVAQDDAIEVAAEAPVPKTPSAKLDPSRPVRLEGGPQDTVIVSAQATPDPLPAKTVTIPPIGSETPASHTAALAPSSPAKEAPPPARPANAGPVTGRLTCSGAPVVQNGEVVFGGLPPGRLQVTYDVEIWDVQIRPDENDAQKIVLKNKRPGVQRKCTVLWQLVN